jgi:hypothetical protein
MDSFKGSTDRNGNSCKNGGVWIEKWEENKKSCNCDLTSYTGKYCQRSKLKNFFFFNTRLDYFKK